MRQHLGFNQFDRLLRVAGLDILVLANDLKDLVGYTFDQRIGRCFLGHDRQSKQQGTEQGEKVFHEAFLERPGPESPRSGFD